MVRRYPAVARRGHTGLGDHKEYIKIKQVTVFLLPARSRIDTLRLQHEVHTFQDEPLMVIIPGVTLSER